MDEREKLAAAVDEADRHWEEAGRQWDEAGHQLDEARRQRGEALHRLREYDERRSREEG
jgi:hypothetical protein